MQDQMASDEKWYFTKEQLASTPSRDCGYDADKEIMCRQQAANFIQDMGQRLQVTQLCINTAIVYMHRFYVFHSFTHFHKHMMAAAALFLAAKVEEQPRKLEHVIKVTQVCLHREPARFDIRSEEYLSQAQDLVFNENVLLQTLGFDVVIDHPHTHVVRCCHLVRASKDLAQTSYFMASNSLHLTTMCLQYKPTVVACFCIHLACKWSNWEIPQSSEGKYWYYYVDRTVTHDLLEQLTTEFLAIFDKAPSRMKRKILQSDKLMQRCTEGAAGAGPVMPEGVTFPPQQRPQHTPQNTSHPQDPNRSSSAPGTSNHPQQTQRVDLREYQGRERERQEQRERDRERHLMMSGTQGRPAEANRDSHYRGHGHHVPHPPGAARGHHHQDVAKAPPPHHTSSSAARPDRPERTERPDRQHRPERPYRPERPPDRPDRPDRLDAASQARHNSAVTQARDQARREQAMARDATKRDQTTGVMFMPPTRHDPVAAPTSDSPDPARTGVRGSGSNLSQDSGIGLNYPGSLESVHSSQDSSDGNRLGFGPSSNSSKEYPGSVPIVSHDGKPKPGHCSTDPLSATRHRMNVVSSDRKGVSLGGDTSGMKDCKPSMADLSVSKGGPPQPPHNHKHSDKTDHQGRHRRHHENLLNPLPSSREDANSSGSASTPYDKKVMQEMSDRRNLEAFFDKKEMDKLGEKHQAAAPYASTRQASTPVVKREPGEEQTAKALPPYHGSSSSHRQGNPAVAHMKREKSPSRQAGTSHSRARAADPTISPQAQPAMQAPVHATSNRAIPPVAKQSSSQKSVPPHPSSAVPHMMKPIKSEPQDTPPMTSRNGTLDEMDSRHDPKRIHTEEAAAPITPFSNIKVEPKLPEQLDTSYGPPYTTSSQPPVKSIFSPEKSATPHGRESPYAQREKLKTPSSDKGLGSFGSPPGSAKGSKRARTSSSSDSEIPTDAARSEEPLVKTELVDPLELISACNSLPLSMPVSVPVSVPVSMPVSVRREPSNGSLSLPSKEAKASKSVDVVGGAFPVPGKPESNLGSQISNPVGSADVEADPLSIKTDPLVPTEPLAGSSQVDEAGHHSHHKSKKKKEKKEKHKHKDRDREKNREEKKHKSKHKEKDKERKKELEASSQSVAPLKMVIKKPIDPALGCAAGGPPVAPVESSGLKIKIPKERIQHVEPPPRDPVVAITSTGLKLKIKCGDQSSATSSSVHSKESRKRDRSSPGDEMACKVPKMVPAEQSKRSSSGANFSRQNGLESRGMGRQQHKMSAAGGASKNSDSSRGGSS